MRIRNLAIVVSCIAACGISSCANKPPPRPVAPPPPWEWVPPSSPQALAPLPGDYSLYVISKALPAYPHDALQDRHQGRVIVRVAIDTNGQILAAKVKESSGYPELDEAALSAVQTWKFHPGRHHGMTTGGVVDLPVNFALPTIQPTQAIPSSGISQ